MSLIQLVSDNFRISQDFYVHFRKAFLHPSCIARYPWSDPQTLEEWRKDPSKKLDILICILLWHLGSDGRSPLKVVDNEVVPSAATADAEESAVQSLLPDKIIVYSAFVSCWTPLGRVSSYDIS